MSFFKKPYFVFVIMSWHIFCSLLLFQFVFISSARFFTSECINFWSTYIWCCLFLKYLIASDYSFPNIKLQLPWNKRLFHLYSGWAVKAKASQHHWWGVVLVEAFHRNCVTMFPCFQGRNLAVPVVCSRCWGSHFPAQCKISVRRCKNSRSSVDFGVRPLWLS